jgi:hypothetical protein
MNQYLENSIKSHPRCEPFTRDAAIGHRAIFDLYDGSELANIARPLWVNRQSWDHVVFVAIFWEQGVSLVPHVDGNHTTFTLFDTHGDTEIHTGAQHPSGPVWHWFNERGDKNRSVIMAFAYTDLPIPDIYSIHVDGGGGSTSNIASRETHGHLSGGDSSEHLATRMSFAGNQDVLSLGPKTVTTESCSHRFGDLGCGATISRSVGRITNWNSSNFSANITVVFNAALPLALHRYIAGAVCPINGASQGNANDVVNIVLVSGFTYIITLGSMPRVPWYPNTFIVIGNGCRKTLAACNENGRLPYMWAMPFTPGTKSFMAGSELVKPTGPNIP